MEVVSLVQAIRGEKRKVCEYRIQDEYGDVRTIGKNQLHDNIRMGKIKVIGYKVDTHDELVKNRYDAYANRNKTRGRKKVNKENKAEIVETT